MAISTKTVEDTTVQRVRGTVTEAERRQMRKWLFAARKQPLDAIDSSMVNQFYPVMLVEFTDAVRRTTVSAARAKAYVEWLRWAKGVIDSERLLAKSEGERDITPSVFGPREVAE